MTTNETQESKDTKYYYKIRKNKYCNIQVPKVMRDELKKVAESCNMTMVDLITLMTGHVNLKLMPLNVDIKKVIEEIKNEK